MSFARRILAKSAKSPKEPEEEKEEMEANIEKMKANAIERQSKISEHEEVMRPDIGSICISRRCQCH